MNQLIIQPPLYCRDKKTEAIKKDLTCPESAWEILYAQQPLSREGWPPPTSSSSHLSDRLQGFSAGGHSGWRLVCEAAIQIPSYPSLPQSPWSGSRSVVLLGSLNTLMNQQLWARSVESPSSLPPTAQLLLRAVCWSKSRDPQGAQESMWTYDLGKELRRTAPRHKDYSWGVTQKGGTGEISTIRE